jgi:asparagine synthase (glutamine-hydrolysing)
MAGLKRLGLAALRLWGKGGTQPYDWLDRSASGQPIFWGGAEAFAASTKEQVLSPRLRERFRHRTSWEAIAPIRERYLKNAQEPTPLQWMTYLDLNFRLPELLLMRVDKMTMGNAVEARVPFLDHELVEWAFGIPDDVKLRNGKLKAVLKNAVRGVIPDAVIERPKQGFGLPIHEWLLEGLPPELDATVDRFVVETDLLDRDAVRALFARRGPAGLCWPLINLSMWWDTFIRPASLPIQRERPVREPVPQIH